MNSPNIRLLACNTVESILNSAKKSGSLDDQVKANLPSIANDLDRAFYRALCYNLCRWHNQLTAISEELLAKPLKKSAFDVQLIINLGLLQLLYMEVADHAAIKESVEIIKLKKKPWATRLVNAVLRAAQRRGKTDLLNSVSQSIMTQTAHPEWIVQAIKRDWPDHFRSILTNNNSPGPLTLRVNSNKISREAYLSLLEQSEIGATPTSAAPYGISLNAPCSVERIPHFFEGWVSVQDEAAQLSAPLLQPQDGEIILDACAAPGGKSAHLAELAPDCKLIANDISETRIQQIKENFDRLGIRAKINCVDLQNFKHTAPELVGKIDSILLDVPCSGLGVIRRHPDIKWLRRAEDIRQLADTQFALARSAWELLKPGGKLLYCSCSILHIENEGVVSQFLANEPLATPITLTIPEAIQAKNGVYLLPSKDKHDGFYFSLMQKSKAN